MSTATKDTEEKHGRSATKGQSRNEAKRIMRELELLCETVGPGGRIPRHTELMSRYGVSQHHVIRSLEELQRQGRIVRRHGSGTFVTDQVKTSRKQTVVAVAKPDASYFDLCVEVLLEQSEQSGIELICRFVGSAQGDDLDLSLHAEPLGIVVFGHNLSALAHGLQARGHRVVLVATPFIGEVFDVPCVYGQQDRGGYLLARHLVDLGHRHFCLCATPEWNLALRSRGHDKAMREADLAGHRVKKTIINQAVVDTWIDKPSLAAEFFAADDAPTAIVMWNDRMAMALIATLSRAGLNVPGDVSVVGYDYLAAGQLGHPSLTTIDPSVRLQVAAAVDLITETDDLKPSQSVVFAPTLVVGESTAPPKSPRLR